MKIIVYINFILTLCLIGGFAWFMVSQKPQNIVSKVGQQENEKSVSYVDTCGIECKKQIETSVSSSVATLSAKPIETIKTVSVTPIPSKTKPQFSYISISGPITTTSSSWYDAPGTDFYLDFNSDYGKNATATWDAFLKVAHSNGTASARLFDVTHGIAVNGSEVSISNNSDLTQITSGNLSFWAGKNLYRVQIKSLNTFEVTFGSGRVKINY